MDNRYIYQYRFEELLNLFKRNRKDAPEDNGESDVVVDICGDIFRYYSRMISNNESWVKYTIERIVINIFDQEDMAYEIPEYDEVSPSGRPRKIHPFSFARYENNKKVAYVISYGLRKGLIEIRKNIRKFKDIDSVKFIFIKSQHDKYVDQLNEIEQEDDNSFLQFFTLKEFFDINFGAEEYPAFISYAEKFNERAKMLIGYKTIATPTAEAVEKFRVKKESMIETIDYNREYCICLPDDQLDIIRHNYIERGLYRLITADSSFADSFISSEWYYGISTATGAIDQTGIVTGYLKSVEQLLFEIIKLYEGRGKRISIDHSKQGTFTGTSYSNGNFIDLIETNEQYMDSTLGSLIRFIRNKDRSGHFFNSDVFDVNEDTMQYLIDTLYFWKDNERNAHLHKDNLYTEEEVVAIRHQVFLLYYLILGSFKIRDTDLERLGLKDDSQKPLVIASDEELLEKIKNWATPIILFDMPKDSQAIAFNFIKFKDAPWDLCLQGLTNDDESKYGDVQWNWGLSYSSSMTNNNLKWESDADWNTGLEQIKRVLKEIIHDDTVLGKKLRVFPKVLLGNMKVEAVLYVRK